MSKFACLKYLALAAALFGATVDAQDSSTLSPTSENQSSLTTTSTAQTSVTTSKATGSSHSSLSLTSTAPPSVTTSFTNALNHSTLTPTGTALSSVTALSTAGSNGTSHSYSDTNATTATTQSPEIPTGTNITASTDFTPTVSTASTPNQTTPVNYTKCGVHQFNCIVGNVTDKSIKLTIQYKIETDLSVVVLNENITLEANQSMKEQVIAGLDFCTNYEPSLEVDDKCNVTCGKSIRTHPKSTFDFKINKQSPKFSVDVTSEMKKCSFTYIWNCSTENNTLIGNGTTFEISTPCEKHNCSITVRADNWTTVITEHLMAERQKPNKPQVFEGKIESTSIEVTWTLTDDDFKHVNEIIVTENASKNVCEMVGELNTIGSHNCTGLKPNKRYTFYVEAKNNDCNGNSQQSEPAIITNETKPGCPEKLTKIDFSLSSNNAIHIKCQKLTPDQWNGKSLLYSVKIEDKFINSSNCEFELKDLDYLKKYNINVRAWNEVCFVESESRMITTLYNDKALIGFLAFLIIATTIALAIVLYKIYILQRKSSRHPEESVELIGHDDEKQLLNVEPIPAEQLIEAYRRKQADESRLFLAEFQSIPRVFSKYAVKEARKSCNSLKNRYIDILPYDYNRVQLSPVSGEQGSDYINASFIDGFNEPRKYIAAQGPKEETADDFWKMVWEQKVTIVVMVTRCEEGKRPKCAQYWPTMAVKSMYFGDLSVRISEEKKCPDYVIRKLFISQKEKSPEREVTHIQFISWPDHGVPENPHLLLKLRQRVNTFRNLFSGPIVVHCSAGVGRTGSYIGIDAMLQALEAEGRVDVYGYIAQLRRQRCLMVQVEAQYILIHQALLEYYLYGETEVNLSELPKHLTDFKKRDPPTEPSLLEAEFQRIPFYTGWKSQTVGRHGDNQSKNRSLSVIPYDYNRIYVKLDSDRSKESENLSDDESSSDESDDEESTKYINASNIEGYWHSEILIATQIPLPETIADFWLMVYQKKAPLIVLLGKLKDDKDCTQYWEDEKKTYEDIEVRLSDCNEQPEFIVRVFEIRHIKKEATRKVYQYHFHDWEESELPESPGNLVNMMRSIKEKLSMFKVAESEFQPPIIAQCSDGAKQTGLFFALWNLLDSADNENVIDVLQTVKALRKERPGMLPTFEQYQFLYDVIANTYPVQNGTLISGNGPSHTSVEVISEIPLENKSQEEVVPDPIENKKEASAEEDKVMSDSSSNNQPTENPTNGPITSDENV
ncbi:receptor-type tyrosine-protein phosphatase C isoform X5 [Pristis pectinata]|uniref:receptor-type tyrosine-protein phosphatase C isoform X5 n=1 Tax=Pristis pectinata TaxID=685728 RepID=UPI00223E8BDE|nr:receptor-type tyrosine-protein phosphatase C isoform X5 [Pristis pectinata]